MKYQRLTASEPATCDKCGLPIEYGELFDLDVKTGFRRCLSCAVERLFDKVAS